SATPTEATTSPTATPTPTETTASTPAPTPTQPSGNAGIAGDIESASSLTVLVNKLTPLTPSEYEPADLVAVTSLGIPSMNGHSLRAEAANAVGTMFAAASAAGYALDMTSGYRSSSLQSELYNGYVASLGQEGADATSARPGYSEHQTGLAADISAPNAGCVLEACFGETAEGQWLAANAWEYGFIVRYPDGLTNITGYEYEPWHFRYVGTAVSTAMHEQGAATYEEFLGAPAAPDYAD
ncbi:MAG: M15 family metallopeptidase, partial [Pseudoclavibacter sp.]